MSADRDYRDLAIEALADGEAALLARVASLEADVAAERLVRHSLLALVHLALADPDGWPKRVASMKAEHRERARGVVHEMVAAHSEIEAAA